MEATIVYKPRNVAAHDIEYSLFCVFLRFTTLAETKTRNAIYSQILNSKEGIIPNAFQTLNCVDV